MFSLLHRRRSRPVAIASLTALALLPALLLLLVGCGQTTTASIVTPAIPPTASASPVATSTLLPPATPLTWTVANLPPGNPMTGAGMGGSSLSIAPNDGNTAYTCTSPAPPLPAPSAQPSVWVTHDRARHWTRAAPIPPVAHYVGWCWVVVDQVNPATAVLSVSWGREAEGPTLKTMANFVTFNGGQSWQSFNGSQPLFMDEFATYQETIIAILGINIDGSDSRWEVSKDRMRTWQRTNQEPAPFWINPTSGELLALGQDSSDGTTQLLDSHDLGQHWTTIATPVGFGSNGPLISPPVANQPWRLCGQAPLPTSLDNPSGSGGPLMCSMDGGHTWVQRPHLTLMFTPPYDKASIDTAEEFAIAPDGTIYAGLSDCYRLAPDTTEWQSLGPIPDVTDAHNDKVATAVVPGAGIIWIGSFSYGIAGFFPDQG